MKRYGEEINGRWYDTAEATRLGAIEDRVHGVTEELYQDKEGEYFLVFHEVGEAMAPFKVGINLLEDENAEKWLEANGGSIVVTAKITPCPFCGNTRPPCWGNGRCGECGTNVQVAILSPLETTKYIEFADERIKFRGERNGKALFEIDGDCYAIGKDGVGTAIDAKDVEIWLAGGPVPIDLEDEGVHEVSEDDDGERLVCVSGDGYYRVDTEGKAFALTRDEVSSWLQEAGDCEAACEELLGW